jgi:Proteobacterial lipase chaperone protein
MQEPIAQSLLIRRRPWRTRTRALLAGACLILAGGLAIIDAQRDAPVDGVDAETYLPSPALEPRQRVPFGSVERALEKLPIGHDGEFVIDSHTEGVLAEATADFPLDQTIEPAAVARHQFLIRKALPPAAGNRFAQLFESYIRYRQAAVVIAEQPASSRLVDERQRLSQLHALRRAHFGEAIAAALFGKEETLLEYMLELRQLDQRTDLSETDKHKAHAMLQSAFEAKSAVTP